MINAIQHSIICETLTIWAAEFATGFPSVHETIYDILAVLAMEFEACTAAVGSVASFVEGTMDTCEEICAELVGVEPAIGLNGAIVPVAMIRNHEMGSGELFRHRMPHWGMAGYLGLHSGCRVTLRKKMGTAPELFGCIETGRNVDTYSSDEPDWVPPDGHPSSLFTRPDVCPFCGSPLDLLNEDLVCTNQDCRSSIGRHVARFVSVGGMGIPGMTERVVDQLLVAGKLDSVCDLYTLKVSDFIEACHITHTDAYVLYRSVDRSKLKPLHMLLDGLGIEGVGREDTPLLAACISDAGGMASLSDDSARFFVMFGASAASRGLKPDVVSAFTGFATKHASCLGKLADMGVAQVAMPVLDAHERETSRSVTAYGDKDAVKPPKKKRFNYGTMKHSEDKKKPRRMKRRKPRKKPGEDDEPSG